MQRQRVIIGIIATIAALVAWEVVASLLFLFLGNLWDEYEFPARLWMFGLYAWELHDNPDVMRLLRLSGGMAMMVPVLILAAVLTLKRRGPRATTDVYGKTEFASREQMQANRIVAKRRPF